MPDMSASMPGSHREALWRQGERLEAILRQQQAAQGELLELLTRKREAISRADATMVMRLCQRESAILQRQGELERERLVVVGEMSHALDPGRRAPLTVSELSERLGGEHGTRLLGLAHQLRLSITETQRLSAVLRNASMALGRHFGGMLEVVQTALGQARVYGRQGRLAAGVTMRSTVDLTS